MASPGKTDVLWGDDLVLWGGAHSTHLRGGWLSRVPAVGRRQRWALNLMGYREDPASLPLGAVLQAAVALSVPGAGQGLEGACLVRGGFPFSARDVARWLEGRFGHCALGPCFGYGDPGQLMAEVEAQLEKSGCAADGQGGAGGEVRLWLLTRHAAQKFWELYPSQVRTMERLHEGLPRLAEVERAVAETRGASDETELQLDPASFQLLCWSFCLEEMVRQMTPGGEWVSLASVAENVRGRGVSLPLSERFVLKLVGRMVQSYPESSSSGPRGLLMAPTRGAAGGGNVTFRDAPDSSEGRGPSPCLSQSPSLSEPTQEPLREPQPSPAHPVVDLSSDSGDRGGPGPSGLDGSLGSGTSLTEIDCLFVHEERTKRPRAEPAGRCSAPSHEVPHWTGSLGKEMVSFVERDKSARKKEMKEARKAVALVQKHARKKWPACRVLLFGSRANDLHLMGGDVDLVILDGPVQNLENAAKGYSERDRGKISKFLVKVMFDLCHAHVIHGPPGKQVGAQVIKAKRVPIIKCRLFPSDLECDISMGVANGHAAVKLTAEYLKRFKHFLRPLLMVLKLFLKQRNMSSPFTGGIGGYTLLNMAVAHLMTNGEGIECHGYLLLRFFEFYGEEFDYANSAVSVNNGGVIDKSFQWFNPGKPNLLAVEDPQQAGNDIGKNSFKMPDIAREFKMAAQRLRALEHARTGTRPSSQRKRWAMVQSAGQDETATSKAIGGDGMPSALGAIVKLPSPDTPLQAQKRKRGGRRSFGDAPPPKRGKRNARALAWRG